MTLEIGLLIFGIILFILGQILSRKMEKKQSKINGNIGAFFQLDTQLLGNGFILIIVSLYLMFIK